MSWIKDRIDAEYRKHKSLDWSQIAESKINMQLKEMGYVKIKDVLYEIRSWGKGVINPNYLEQLMKNLRVLSQKSKSPQTKPEYDVRYQNETSKPSENEVSGEVHSLSGNRLRESQSIAGSKLVLKGQTADIQTQICKCGHSHINFKGIKSVNWSAIPK